MGVDIIRNESQLTPEQKAERNHELQMKHDVRSSRANETARMLAALEQDLSLHSDNPDYAVRRAQDLLDRVLMPYKYECCHGSLDDRANLNNLDALLVARQFDPGRMDVLLRDAFAKRKAIMSRFIR